MKTKLRRWPEHQRKNSHVGASALAAVALFSLLPGCGGGDGGGGSTPAPPTTYTATATKPCASGPALTATSQVSQAAAQSAADAQVPSACPPLTAAELAQVSLIASTDPLTGQLATKLTGLPAGVELISANLTLTGPAGVVTGSIASTGKFTESPSSAAKVKFGTAYTGGANNLSALTFANAPSIAGKAVTLTTPDYIVGKVTIGIGVVYAADEVTVVSVDPSKAVRTWLTPNPMPLLVGDDAWLRGVVVDKTIVLMDSGASALHPTSGLVRKFHWTIYKSPIGSNCIKPVLSDTGENWDSGASVGGFFCFTGDAPAYIVTTRDGFIMRLSGANSNYCARYRLNTAPQVACPF